MPVQNHPAATLLAVTSEPIVNQVIVTDCGTISEDIHTGIDSCDLTDASILESFLDEATWDTRRTAIEASAEKGIIGAAYMVHPGTTMNATCRTSDEPYGRKANNHDIQKKARIDTCLALRLLQLIGIFTSFGIPWLLIIPQVTTSTFSMLDLPDYKDIKKKHFTYSKLVDDKLSLDLCSSMDLHAPVNIATHLIDMLTSKPTSSTSMPDKRSFLQERLRQARDTLHEHDGLRREVGRVTALRGETTADQRAAENAEALGGMRNPAKALKNVLGHIKVANDVKAILKSFLYQHPEVNASILHTIGRSRE